MVSCQGGVVLFILGCEKVGHKNGMDIIQHKETGARFYLTSDGRLVSIAQDDFSDKRRKRTSD